MLAVPAQRASGYVKRPDPFGGWVAGTVHPLKRRRAVFDKTRPPADQTRPARNSRPTTVGREASERVSKIEKQSLCPWYANRKSRGRSRLIKSIEGASQMPPVSPSITSTRRP